MVLDESESLEIFNCYNRVASGDEDTDGSNLDNHSDTECPDSDEDTDTEGSDSEEDMDGEGSDPDQDTVNSVYDSDATISEEENELMTEEEADGGLVWWVSGGEGEEEEEEEDSDWDSDNQPTPTVRKGAKKHHAAGASTQPPRNQQFPATPPQSLSSEAQAEWTLRRDRKSYYLTSFQLTPA